MFVLFENNSSNACGYNKTIQPFTTGIYIDNVETLTKNGISFLHNPSAFTKIDILQYKKDLILQEGYSECMMYEFDINKFVDLDNTSCCNIAKDYIEIKQKGIVRFLPIKIKDYSELQLKIDCTGNLTKYYSLDNNNFIKCTKTIKNNNEYLHIQLKNNTKENITVYGYQVLMRGGKNEL